MPELKIRADHSSGKWENFPAGLRVLVVDDDSLCLKVIAQMLRSCKYEVTTSMSSAKALDLLRDHRKYFDLVLSDVFMPDMDGFKLLETIGLELCLPVIMMSSSGDTTVVFKGVTHGAVDFLIKPVRVEELRNVWQHVVRRRKELAKDIEADEGGRPREDSAGGETSRKRKENSKDGKGDEGYASKKPRVNWSVEMHQQFVNAVNQLGIDKAVPKKILELMSVKGLTRENVASHLQKYRLYLKRIGGVQATNTRTRSPSVTHPPQKGSEPPVTATTSPSGNAAPNTMFPPPVPGPVALMGSMPQGTMCNLIPALGTLGSNPNLANMQLQLQNMHIQGGLPLGGGLDASSLVQTGAVMSPTMGLGMGLGSLHAQALMSMGLMAGAPVSNGGQFHGAQLGLSRSASVPSGVEMGDVVPGQLRRHASALPNSGEVTNTGHVPVPVGSGNVQSVVPVGNVPTAGVPGVNPAPIPILNRMNPEMVPGMIAPMTGLEATVLSEAAPFPGQHGKAVPNTPVANSVRCDLQDQVKQEDPSTRLPGGHQRHSNLDAKVLESQHLPGAADIVTAPGLSDESLMTMGLEPDLGAFANGEFPSFADTGGIGGPLEETKDMGMDEFLNFFLRDTSVPTNDAAV